ncbi:MAG: hydrogenase 4 subunit B [Eggerthellaceae bacterium]|nr:hydrogenase 4 subunit B [Eggerthellaceae bacterium]
MLELLYASLGLSVAGAVLALVAGRSPRAAKAVACVFGMLAALASFGSGAIALTSPAALVTFVGPMPFTNFTLLLNPLAGLLMCVISVLAFVAWLYGLSYFDEYLDRGMGSIGFFMNLFIASMMLVILSDNAFWFLVFFELMSLTSYMLVIVEQNEKSFKGGFLYLVMAHIGFLMIAISFFLMATATGSLEFESFREAAFEPGLATAAFFLAFFGFGAKAGIVPFHSWLPQAHPAAPSNVSALMSGGMIKIGIFGICKVCFDLLGAAGGQVSWGIVVVIIGAVSSVLGVAYALREHDLKSLLAYHSVENIGIILLGVGTGIVGWASGNVWLAGIGLMAGLYHLVNHAMFKGLLFLGAGSVLHATGTRNMEILGGLARVMPVTAVCFLMGSLAISAIPPLNGFVSEWFTYQGLIGAAMTDDILLRVVFAFAVVALAITGALAVTCFVKAFGVTFLGEARSDAARNAHEVPLPMKASMVLLTVICVALGLGAAWFTPLFSDIASSVLAAPAAPAATGAVLVSLDTASAVSPLLIFVLLACVFAVCLLMRNAANAKAGVVRDEDPWACGYAPDTHMEALASTVGAHVGSNLTPLYTLRSGVNGAGNAVANFVQHAVAPEDAAADAAKGAQDGATRPLSDSVLSVVHSLGTWFSRLESGDFRTYIVYIVVALVFFLALIILVR